MSVVPIIRELEVERFKSDVPAFRSGDTVRVSVRIREGEKERLQDYEGLCIRRRGGGLSETFTLRRSAFGVSMERIFPLHSPRIESIEVTRYGRVRRARLYYLRDLKGKAARIADLRDKPGRGTKAHSALLGKGKGEDGVEAGKRRKRGAKAKVARKEAAVVAAANPVPKKKKPAVDPKKAGAKGGAKKK